MTKYNEIDDGLVAAITEEISRYGATWELIEDWRPEDIEHLFRMVLALATTTEETTDETSETPNDSPEVPVE